jgi:hypothetical protein
MQGDSTCEIPSMLVVLGGVMARVLATGPKVRGLKPGLE